MNTEGVHNLKLVTRDSSYWVVDKNVLEYLNTYVILFELFDTCVSVFVTSQFVNGTLKRNWSVDYIYWVKIRIKGIVS